MKVYKTKPDKYGWFINARLRKNGYLDLEKRKIGEGYRIHWQWIQIHIKDLMKILKELKKGDEND